MDSWIGHQEITWQFNYHQEWSRNEILSVNISKKLNYSAFYFTLQKNLSGETAEKDKYCLLLPFIKKIEPQSRYGLNTIHGQTFRSGPRFHFRVGLKQSSLYVRRHFLSHHKWTVESVIKKSNSTSIINKNSQEMRFFVNTNKKS